MTDAVIGWDLGGAHLKASRLNAGGAVEEVVQLPCRLWQGMQHLDAAVIEALPRLGRAPVHAVTMTGEMVDLFPDRVDGVGRIAERMQGLLAGVECRYYAGQAGFVRADAVASIAPQIASANWRASAELVAMLQPDALFVDVGSTTTDIVAIVAGGVVASGDNDAERLVSRELVYTGVVRTPVMALARTARVQNEDVPLMAEYFATTADVYRLTGELPSDADLHPAADGGEKTPQASARRLARMVGRDARSGSMTLWTTVARDLARGQVERIMEAMSAVAAQGGVSSGALVIGAGIGRFIVAKAAAALGRPTAEFGELIPAARGLGGMVSDCAPAVAVALLAQRGSR